MSALPDIPLNSLPPDPDHPVRQYFESAAGFWKDVYQEDTLSARIYQERMQLAFRWIDELGLAPSSKVLDVGCGAGLATVALAQRGFEVHAVDLSPGMLDQTASVVRQAGLSDRVQPRLARAEELPFENGTFTLVLALGVLPWLERPGETVAEWARVTSPGGFLLISADNHWRTDHLFDPALTPVLRPARQALGKLRQAVRLRQSSSPVAINHRASEVRQYTQACGFEVQREATLGFGPFSLLKYPVLTKRQSLWVHQFLQKRASRGQWPWTYCGRQYLQLSNRSHV